MSPVKKKTAPKKTEQKVKQIRFIKPFAANVEGDLSDAIKSISKDNKKSYFYKEGQVPGVGCPPLRNELGSKKVIKLDENGEQVTTTKIIKGNEKIIPITQTVDTWLYDALVEGKVAEEINMKVNASVAMSDEDMLLQHEASCGVSQEELDKIYRDYGARTINQKLQVIADLETAQENIETG